MANKETCLPRELLDKPLRDLSGKDLYLLFNFLKNLMNKQTGGDKCK